MHKEKELDELIARTERARALTYEMMDYARTRIAWIFEIDKKYNILSLEDIEKAERFLFKSGKLLEQYEEAAASSDETLQGDDPTDSEQNLRHGGDKLRRQFPAKPPWQR